VATYGALRARWARPHALHPSDIALGGDAPDLPPQGVSFDALDLGVRRAVALLQSSGVQPGDVVALQCRRDRAFLELYLGALALGAISLPLNPAYTPRERDWFLSDAQATLAVLLEPGPGHLAADELRPLLDAQAPAPLPAGPKADDLAVLLYTSGTTGRPKGAMISHANLMATLEALHDAWGWSPQDHLLHALPLFHVHGLFVAMLGALWAGARTTWLARFSPGGVLAGLQRVEGSTDSCTVFMGVPTFYHRLLAHPEPFGDLSEMRLFTSGSAPLPAATHAAFTARAGHTILERYGMTEVGIVLSNPLEGERRPGAVGFPLPGVRARVAVPGGDQPVGQGQIGEIRIAGPSVVRGYLGRPEATAAALGDGEMRTGDLGRVDADGYFHIVGRMGDMIISGGLNVYPREVEAALLRHPAVAEAAIVGVPHPDWGEQVVGLVVCRSPVGPDELLVHARTELAAYKCPKVLLQVEALPRNAMGKVQKHRIREQWAPSDPS